ncbi:MAG: FHA domain-containing protein [Pseudomonadota bacterium]
MVTVKICPVCEAHNPPAAQRCASCSAMLIGVDITEQADASVAPIAGASADATRETAATIPDTTAATASASVQPVPRRCPHADCGQLNPPGAERCVYCNRLMEDAQASDPPALRARIRWPWAEETQISDRLMIGREAPAPPALAARLEREFSNVSRRHTELVIDRDSLWIVDLGSANGTFVNDTRLTPNQRVRLANGARLRFAANLTVLVSIRDDRP